MINTHEREKLLNAIIFFASRTENCGKTKLFKLLFLLDFEHFKQTGRNVTGLDYYAWPMGPVPADLNAEFDYEQNSADFNEAVDVVEDRVRDFRMLKLVPKREFDPANFSKRELNLLERIASEHEHKYAKEMVDVTHAENGVWDRVWADGAGRYLQIPYELAVEGENSARLIDKHKEFSALKLHYAN